MIMALFPCCIFGVILTLYRQALRPAARSDLMRRYIAYMMEEYGNIVPQDPASTILSLRLRSSIILLKGLKYIRP